MSAEPLPERQAAEDLRAISEAFEAKAKEHLALLAAAIPEALWRLSFDEAMSRDAEGLALAEVQDLEWKRDHVIARETGRALALIEEDLAMARKRLRQRSFEVRLAGGLLLAMRAKVELIGAQSRRQPLQAVPGGKGR